MHSKYKVVVFSITLVKHTSVFINYLFEFIFQVRAKATSRGVLRSTLCPGLGWTLHREILLPSGNFGRVFTDSKLFDIPAL